MSLRRESANGIPTPAAAFKVGTSITHDDIPAADVVQLTSGDTATDATGVANPHDFDVSTFDATLSAGSFTTSGGGC